MKSIVCMQPNELKMIEAQPPVRGQGEALVQIRRIGICGTDLHAYRGNQPFFTYPRVLGHELSGTILQSDSSDFQIGAQVSVIPYLECGSCIACRNGKTNCCTQMKVLGVHTDGGMREIIAVPTSHLIKTDGISLDQAALLEPLSIGAHAVRRSGLQQGELALVIGAGPIGLGVMVLAKQRGAKVIAMDMNEERLRFCQEWAQVDYTVNVLNQPLEALAEITDGDLPTVVFDATGNAKSMMDAFTYVSHGGRLVYVGLVKADIAFNDPDFHKKELTLMSSRNATREDFDTVIQAVRDGAVDIDRYITHRVRFDHMIDEFEKWYDPANGVIKAIVEL
ncbi:zinc-binding alcohol dehydrogenase family protein [Paenibacillus sp. WQ 127069]|uniref:Zinc-binding alcohol dehydrogenase family protein n=1 Tax=Paenibacillus baimaensis TaxID=2982185 RepID=A0ABT2UU46_9BACL|nr:zinc-binding alcohol dehydrogenase family protein [Paenibacillus sp. WQ 127069]MCU6798184.1 zinc-binding alcohol dehydrogenase family protein [Paenibacillus sp. WQ 127069]